MALRYYIYIQVLTKMDNCIDTEPTNAKWKEFFCNKDDAELLDFLWRNVINYDKDLSAFPNCIPKKY